MVVLDLSDEQRPHFHLYRFPEMVRLKDRVFPAVLRKNRILFQCDRTDGMQNAGDADILSL